MKGSNPPTLRCDLKIWGPPGTGKTYHGAEFIAERTTQAEDVVAITYRRDLARDLRAALEARGVVPAVEGPPWPGVGTIHGVARRALGYKMDDCAAAVGAPEDIDDDTRERRETDFHRVFFEDTRTPYHGSDRVEFGRERGDLLLAVRSWLVNTRGEVPLNRYPMRRALRRGRVTPEAVERFQAEWEDFKSEHGLWDWDDLLRDALDHGAVPGGRYLFLDEAQDNSPLMHALVALWAGEMDGVAVAGDPNQAIYSFIGADPELFWVHTSGREEKTLKRSRRLPSSAWPVARETLRFSGHRVPDLCVNGTEGSVNFLRLRDVLDVVSPEFETFHLVRARFQAGNVKNLLERAGVPYRSRLGGGWRDTHRRLLNALLKAPSVFDDEGGDGLDMLEARELVKVCPAEHVRGTKKELLARPPRDGVRPGDWGEFFKPSVRGWLRAPLENAVQLRPAVRRRLGNALGRVSRPLPGITHEITTIHAAKGREAEVVFLYDGVTRRIKRGARPYQRKPQEARVWFVGLTRHRLVLNIVEAEGLKRSPFIRRGVLRDD